MNTPVATPNPVQNARSLTKDFQEKFSVFRECLPLAIGIDKQLLARLPGLDRKLLRIALGIHTNSLRYLKAMEKATVRHDLDGNAADEVTDEHRAHASKLIGERFKKDAERRKAQREAELQARQRTEKLGQLIEKFGRTN
jgi:ProP effector